MVGITPYMRCSTCRRVMTLKGIERHCGCICGTHAFVNVKPTILEKFVVWLFRR